MKRFQPRIHLLVSVFVALVFASVTGFAQWLHYPTDGIPRKADGKPDLAAPAPKLPDGKPDLSGLWHATQARQCTNAKGDSTRAALKSAGHSSAATSAATCLAASCRISHGRRSSPTSGMRR
jgi:hypothetical protein